MIRLDKDIYWGVFIPPMRINTRINSGFPKQILYPGG
jgi:hypothetical protein